jgi:hypothetical protein
MSINADPRRRRKTRRIYYGPPGSTEPYWNVKVKPATKSVRINGTLEHAIRGISGATVGCTLSNCADANKKAFGHEFIMAVFTKKTCIIITKMRNGEPSEGIEYYHDYSDIVMLNDKGLKKHFKDNPHLVERTFTLRPPEKVRVRPNSERPSGPRVANPTGEKRSFAPRGAMERAVTAGLLGKGVARALSGAIAQSEPNTPSLKLARRTMAGMKAA